MAAASGATGAAYAAAAPSNVSYGQYGSAPAGAGIYGHPQPAPGAYAQMPPGLDLEPGSGREVLYGPPPSLTSGLSEQRSSQSLELQRKQQIELINTQASWGQAEQQKKRLFMQIDQQVKTQEMALTQQYNQQLLQLNQQYHQQKDGSAYGRTTLCKTIASESFAALEQQAMQLTMEGAMGVRERYQQQKMHEEMVKKQMELHREHYEVQARFQQDPMGPTGGGYMPPMVQDLGQGIPAQVPPPMPVMPDMAPGAGATYVPSYTGSGSYVPPPGGCNGIIQPQMPTYGPSAAAMGNYAAAPPTNYGWLPLQG
ncbi:hypothetical protein AK812_SmicGene37924 [Symbiodinium microadriaticum]|uniref:Uncharacterized protein n=1 Tax=Symbiodinium microadriaticum TaxID=2951 RepID=A0A1Q9CF13_SYMMI|nr:hypothetical protein AK812_SmicGene37924 [Symbiodinium microadriaticum]